MLRTRARPYGLLLGASVLALVVAAGSATAYGGAAQPCTVGVTVDSTGADGSS
jgi:hypothetical protein